MPEPITPRHFDAELAEAMLTTNDRLTGIPQYLGITIVDVGPARLAAEIELRPELLNPAGVAHGAVISGLVDHVLGSVMYPVIDRGRWAATTEFKLNLLRAVRSGVVRAESTVVAMTRTTAVVQVEVFNEGNIVALAQGTVLIPEPRA
jgi:uncharacterized protein (TIGR00369 family)